MTTANEIAALQPHAALNLKTVRVIREKQFCRRPTFPRDPALIRVARFNLQNTGVSPKVFSLGDQRDDWQRSEGLGVAEYISTSSHVRHPRASAKRRRTNDRGFGDRNRRLIQLAFVRCRQRKIGRVTDPQIVVFAAQRQRERLSKEAAFSTKLRFIENALKTARTVLCAGRRLNEIDPFISRRETVGNIFSLLRVIGNFVDRFSRQLRTEQTEVTAGRAELEIRMQRHTRHPPIFAGGV